jgi:hypothetical protein
MAKRLDSIDAENWYLVTILGEELGVTFDIDFFQHIKFVATGLKHLRLHLFT